MKSWLLWSTRTRVLVVAGAVVLAIAGGAGTAVAFNQAPVGFNRATPSPRPATAPRTQLGLTFPSPTASTTPGPSPSATSDPLSCRLPVSGAFSSNSGGFVTFPAGTYSQDPAAAVSLPNSAFAPGATYDRGLARWLPVPRDWVAPDGRHYAYIDRVQSPAGGGGYLHIVDVASGQDARISYDHGASAARTNEWWSVLGYEPEGVYLISGSAGGTSLWLVDSGGGFRQVGGNLNWQWVGGGGAWGVAGTSPQGGPLQRHDLATGADRTWIQRPGMSVQMLGLDGGGRALVLLANELVSEIWLVDSSGGSTKIHSAPGWSSASSLRSNGPVVVDSHGLWIGTSLGIFLYSSATGITRVSETPARIAGTCI